jgi:F0F1-type ATP synthase assembly protein I
MTLGLIVSLVVLVSAVVVGILGYLIDRSAEV